MIRLVYLLRRHPDLSFSEFQDYWREQHAPLVQEKAAALGIQKYVQLGSIQEPAGPTTDALRGEMLEPYDGVAEYWFEDMASLLQAKSDNFASDADLIKDERAFVDHTRSAAWIAYEIPHINPTPENVLAAPDSSISRLFYVLNQLPNQTVEAAQAYWRVQHGPLVRSFGPDIQTLRYVQVHRLEHEFNQALRQTRGLAEAYYGHAELWFDQTSVPLPGAKQASVALYEDETRFIDFSRSAIWFGKEQVLVGEGTLGAGI